MRVLLQRATQAQVSVDGEVVGRLAGTGLVAFVGATHTDTPAVAAQLAAKAWTLRILDDELSAADLAAPFLVVSQFTLYANMRKGRRPSWNNAAPAAVGEPLVDAFVAQLRTLGAHVETGRFGAHMQVALVNDGPVTIWLDSADLQTPRRG
jgi:D-tyrosyl-tRNA(Tyr) deacylase